MKPRWLNPVLAAAVIFFVSPAHAGKFDVLFGGYSINAQTSAGSGTSSNLGDYRAIYAYGITPQIDLFLGFTVVFSNVISGDMGFGFDLGMDYFPFTSNGPYHWTQEGVSLDKNELIRPYVGISFNEREFQVVNASTYGGGGVAAGVERALTEKSHIKAEARYLFLSGPSQASAQNFDFTIGYGISF